MVGESICAKVKELKKNFIGMKRVGRTNIGYHGMIIIVCWIFLFGLFGCAALNEVNDMESVTGPCKVECNEKACKHADCLGFNAGLGRNTYQACIGTRSRYAECMRKCKKKNPPN